VPASGRSVPAQSEQFRPTRALPGTRAKLDEIAARLAAGLPLFHPEDELDFSPYALESDPEVSSANERVAT
jgi:hypothetical protein